MRVRLYRNLHQRGTRAWSILAREGPQKGKVLDVVSGAAIRSASFIVNEGGRQRVIREKQKNVHAFVEGELEHTWPLGTHPGHAGASVRIGYDPYRMATFQREDCWQPVATSALVIATPDGVYAKLPPCAGGVRGLAGFDEPTDVDDWNG